ncbi:hypothetical protein Tco_0779389 [Tanacetum coccineum]
MMRFLKMLDEFFPGDIVWEKSGKHYPVFRECHRRSVLAKHGFTEMQMVEINAVAGNLDYLNSIPKGIHKNRGSNQEHERISQRKEMLNMRHM